MEDVLDTSARLLRLLSLLQSRPDWSGPELSERLGVTTRTVRRDVDRLRELGYPIAAAKGPDGGYRLGAGTELPPLLFDDEQAVALTVALQIAATTQGSGLAEPAARALNTVRQVMPTRLRNRITALSVTAVDRPTTRPPEPVDGTVLLTISAAVHARETLRFDYSKENPTSTAGPTSADGPARRAEPHHVITWDGRWYVVAWDLNRDDWSVLRADRITLRTPNGPRFTPRPLPTDDVAAHVSRGASTSAWRYRAAVIVHAPAADVAARINPAAGSVEPGADDRSCVFHTGADSIETLAVHLSLLDVDFTVTEPVELVARLRTLADRYSRSTPGG